MTMPRQKKHGFTLIELLVVIAIIAVLIALLMPALAMAIADANTTVCVSNLHQLGMEAQEYATTYQDSYPPGYYNYGNPSWALDHLRNAQSNQWIYTPGILFMGQTNLQILVCPMVHQTPATGQIVLGYNYNTSYIGHGAMEGPGETMLAPARRTDVQNPSTCALFGDGGWTGGIDYWMRAPVLLNPVPSNADSVSDAERASGTQAFRHQGYTNVVYCDGHAASQKQCFTNTQPTPAAVGPGTGFLSADNSAYETNLP
jgi:prepilin-type N-terminal cleavage/methylation domain-containing protein/prepilin-type processing-associated H-X9-DG protein